MTETEAPKAPEKAIAWDAVVPKFSSRLREPVKPARPSDGAIRMAQLSYDGRVNEATGETEHAITHRFPTIEAADVAEDELKRAAAYTNPESTVSVVRDPENTGDKRIIRWRAGAKRGRKTS